jgi:hypothetical protein
MTKLIILIIVTLVITIFLFKKIVENDYKKKRVDVDNSFDESEIYK